MSTLTEEQKKELEELFHSWQEDALEESERGHWKFNEDTREDEWVEEELETFGESFINEWLAGAGYEEVRSLIRKNQWLDAELYLYSLR